MAHYHILYTCTVFLSPKERTTSLLRKKNCSSQCVPLFGGSTIHVHVHTYVLAVYNWCIEVYPLLHCTCILISESSFIRDSTVHIYTVHVHVYQYLSFISLCRRVYPFSSACNLLGFSQILESLSKKPLRCGIGYNTCY